MAQRDGKRPGAGRKSSEVLAAQRVTAAPALLAVDERKVWVSLISSKDERIKLDAMKYLADWRDGKAIRRREIAAIRACASFVISEAFAEG